MYEQFYGLQGRPFQLTPDPHYYFESATHRKALSYLGYGLAQGEGFIVITGDIGAGKTTLVGHLMQTIDPLRLTAVKIVSTQVEGDDMLRLAAQSFGLATEGFTKAATLQKIEGYLHGQARAGRRTLLIVDEAQNLTAKQMKTLITRAGPGSKFVCLGNISQIDTPYLSETTSGLTFVVDRFKRWDHSGHMILTRGERSRLADYATQNL